MLTAVLLSSDRGGQVHGDHLKQSITGRQPLTHHSLQQGLPFFLLVIWRQFDVQFVQQLLYVVLSEVLDGIDQLKGKQIQVPNVNNNNNDDNNDKIDICDSCVCFSSP